MNHNILQPRKTFHWTPYLFCLSVSVKWLAVKTASEMTYTVSSGALNSAPTPTPTYLVGLIERLHSELLSLTRVRSIAVEFLHKWILCPYSSEFHFLSIPATSVPIPAEFLWNLLIPAITIPVQTSGA